MVFFWGNKFFKNVRDIHLLLVTGYPECRQGALRNSVNHAAEQRTGTFFM